MQIISYICSMIGLISDKTSVMCSSEAYSKIQDSSIGVIMETIVDRIEKEKICPDCKMECEIHSGKTRVLYHCPKCGSVRVTLF